MAKSLTEMAAEIASAQAGHAKMSAEEMEQFLGKTFEALHRIKAMEEGGVAAVPLAETEKPAEPPEPKKSIQQNRIICLECGKEFKQISNVHLKSHGLTASPDFHVSFLS